MAAVSTRPGLASAAPSAPVAAGKLGRETLADRLAVVLSREIEAGGLGPGDRLPTEAQLASTHGVSRSVVREAVHRVKSRGLLVSRQGSGVFVAVPAEHQPLHFDPEVLESVTAVVHVVEVRRALEGEMAALAAERASRTQVAGLRRALAAIDAAAEAGRDGVPEDMAFHRAIGEATGNPQFVRLIGFLEQYLRDAMHITRGNEARRLDFMEAVRNEHRVMVEAIAARDPAAARRAVLKHLVNGERRLERGGVIPARRSKTAARR